MTSLGAARAEMAAAITAAGQPGTTDPTAQTPLVLVDAGMYTAASGVGAWNVTVPVRCVVPGPGNADALAALEAMVEAVLGVLGWAAAEPGTWAPAPNVAAMPCYTLAYSRLIPNPAC